METENSKSYILITGGSGGIGSALSKLIAEKNLFPIIGYNSNSDHANCLAKKFNTFAVKIDLRSEISISTSIKFISKNLKTNDKLLGSVFCASPPPDIYKFLDTKPTHLLNQFQINVVGHQILLGALIKNFFLKKKEGIVVGILSQAIGLNGKDAATSMTSYIIAKSAFKSMLSVCKSEFNWMNVKMIFPSFTNTKMLDVFDTRYIEILNIKKKILSPEKIAKQIVNEMKI